jgi:colanic acid biosynthesis glycosyl transferase WcaI
MKIVIYSANFAPEPTGIGKYSGEMAAWLAKRGHQVRAISAPPYYPNWEVRADYRGKGYRRELIDGVEVWRAPLWVPKAPNGLARILHLMSFAVASFPLMIRQLFWGPQMVIVVAPALVCAPAALLIARLCGAQAWLHLQDFEVDIAFRMNLLRGALLRRVILRMERWLLRRFDVVSSISGRMAERLLLKGVEYQRVRYFPNWVDISHIKPAGVATGLRAELGIAPETIVAMFSGSLGGKQGLQAIPAAAELLRSRADILFLICGDGMLKPQLEQAAADLTNLRLLPLQPFERLGELLCSADIHLLPQSADAADLVLPSKLSGMLASGRPVIATCHPGTELHEVVSQCGAVVEPQDPAALAAAIVRFADDAAHRAEMGRRARSYAEMNFERDAVLERVFGVAAAEEGAIPDDAVA